MNRQELSKFLKGVSINKVRKLQKQFKKVDQFVIKSNWENYNILIQWWLVFNIESITWTNDLNELKEILNKWLKKYNEIKTERTKELLEEITKNDNNLKDLFNWLL